ncbi:MAG: GNAT family N-acetyltransferase [Candidatus Riflebacteria bacterium]|nr:GNAT family N-acetyltransferase [Candidatus Riflebacteria bacterium]
MTTSEYRRLNSEDLIRFRNLIPSEIRDKMKNSSYLDSLRGVGIEFFGQPLGLALARILEKNAFLISVFVEPPFRKKRIATGMLSSLTEYLKEEKVEEIKWIFEKRALNASIIEKILIKQNWEPAVLLDFSASVSQKESVDRLMQSEWMKSSRIPDGVTLKTFNEIPKKILDEAKTKQLDDDFPDEVCMLEERLEIDPELCVAAIHGESIIGWMTISKTKNGKRFYNSLYLDPRFRQTGLGVILIAEVIKKHFHADMLLPNRGGEWQMKAYRKPMARLFHRRLKKYLDNFTERYICKKNL